MNKNEILLKPKIDVVFHALFRKKNNAILEAMLTDILDTKVKIIENLDRHLDIAIANEKLGVMDLRVRFEDGTYCNIEIQLKEYQYENERFLYYLADTYSRQLERGEKYKEINKTISIVIVDHEIEALKGLEELNVRWQIRDNTTGDKMLTDRFELVIIELPKARRIYEKNENNTICQWMMFLDNPNSKEVIKIMDKNDNIKNAREQLKQVSGDYELRRIAELREKYIRDEQAALDFATEKGLRLGTEQGMKQGIKQGRNEATIQTAKNMIDMGLDVEIISKATGLSKEKILELK